MTQLSTRILATGSYLPGEPITNADLVARLAENGIQSSDAWIVERTGIKARHYAATDEKTSDLALAACQRALQSAGVAANSVDLIVVATSTPDMIFPSTASILQHKLGVNNGGASFDVQAVCCGFIYALSIAHAMIQNGSAKRALVVGVDVFSRILDFSDRTTCVLFGDGAGAVLLEAAAVPGILATDLHSDGAHRDILCTPGGVVDGKVFGDPFLRMDGQAVFKLAVRVLEETARACLAKANKQTSDIDWLIPHQANIRIMQGTAKKLGVLEKLIACVEVHGNTSAASIPLALDVGVRSGRIQPGHTVLLEGVGGGFTWGSAVVTL